MNPQCKLNKAFARALRGVYQTCVLVTGEGRQSLISNCLEFYLEDIIAIQVGLYVSDDFHIHRQKDIPLHTPQIYWRRDF